MNGLEEPEEVMTVNYREFVNIRTTISDEETAEKVKYWKEKKELLKPFMQCKYATSCCTECDIKIKAEAEEYSKKIFNEFISETCNDKDKFKEVYDNVGNKLKEYTNKEPSKTLVCCTKVHLIRKILYDTKINISIDETNEIIASEFDEKVLIKN